MMPAQNRHLLYGAMVGGPDLSDRYQDDRSDYVKNEVAIDYNAGLQGALAALAEVYGGQIDPSFPQPEKRDDEFFTTARINAEGDNFIEIALKLHNHSSWPARVANGLTARYYLSLAEIKDHQNVYQNIKVTSNYNQGAQISNVKPLESAAGLYYVEADFSQANVKPTSESDSQKELQFRLNLPIEAGRWQLGNDWSFGELVSFEFRKTPKIPVFVGGRMIWGSTP
jgi:hypothetical protein